MVCAEESNSIMSGFPDGSVTWRGESEEKVYLCPWLTGSVRKQTVAVKSERVLPRLVLDTLYFGGGEVG